MILIRERILYLRLQVVAVYPLSDLKAQIKPGSSVLCGSVHQISSIDLAYTTCHPRSLGREIASALDPGRYGTTE